MPGKALDRGGPDLRNLEKKGKGGRPKLKQKQKQQLWEVEQAACTGIGRILFMTLIITQVEEWKGWKPNTGLEGAEQNGAPFKKFAMKEMEAKKQGDNWRRYEWKGTFFFFQKYNNIKWDYV